LAQFDGDSDLNNRKLQILDELGRLSDDAALVTAELSAAATPDEQVVIIETRSNPIQVRMEALFREIRRLDVQEMRKTIEQTLAVTGRGSKILKAAAREATDLLETGLTDASELLETAEEEAVELLETAEQEAAELIHTARQEAVELRDDAQRNADDLIDSAISEATGVLDEAQEEFEDHYS
jgi:putative NIF3 family GTP cyclohydrolase 1 type 2